MDIIILWEKERCDMIKRVIQKHSYILSQIGEKELVAKNIKIDINQITNKWYNMTANIKEVIFHTIAK